MISKFGRQKQKQNQKHKRKHKKEGVKGDPPNHSRILQSTNQ